VPDPITRLRVVVDELVELDPVSLSEVALEDALVELRRVMDRQEAVFARLAHAGHVRGVAAAPGAYARGRRQGRDRSRFAG
jgi:hypothetical protein